VLRWYQQISWYYRFIAWMPHWFVDNRLVKGFIYLFLKDKVKLEPSYWFFGGSCAIMSFFGMFWLSVPYFWFNLMVHSFAFAIYEKFRCSQILGYLAQSDNAIPRFCRNMREKRSYQLFAFASVLGAALILYRSWRRLENQSEKVRVFPKEEFNPWKKSEVESIVVSDRSKSMNVEQCIGLVKKNLVHVKMNISEGVSQVCDAFFVKANYAILPNHVIRDEPRLTTFTRTDPSRVGPNFKSYVGRANSINIIGTDLALVHLPSGGTSKDLIDLFIDEPPKEYVGELVYKNKLGETTVSRARCIYDESTRNQSGAFPGYTYHLPENTFNGLCCATWIGHSINPYIVGFHLGGFSNSTLGCSGFLSRNSIVEFIDRLNEKLNITSVASAGVFETQTYGVDFTPIGKIHDKSPVNFLRDDACIVAYGMHPLGVVKSTSDVVDTVISKAVEEEMHVPNIWGPASFTREAAWKPWQKYLEGASCPALGFKPSVTLRAYRDYLAVADRFIDGNTSWLNKMYVLDEVETVSGIDGFRFVDGMVASTSCGWPLNKSKSAFIHPVDEVRENITMPRNLERQFWDEAYRMEQCYLKGERAYPVFRSSLKDEPTKITKDKTRVFQASAVALQLLIRKYFLTIIHTLSKNPKVFELAVGINCTGPEWHDLTEHMIRFGSDRVVAGDFKAFDQQMPAELVLYSFEFMIHLAKRAGFTENDLIIMKGVATDVAYPLIEINGEFVQLFGSNPSGQNLTVYTNSIVNALYHRCAYYTVYEDEKVPPFNEVMSLMTYGDDCKGSVKVGYDKFNHTSIAQALRSAGVEYTMADKTSESVPFISNGDASFLKRNAVWNDEVQMWFGPLEEDSIMKSLHSVVRSKAISAEEVAAQNIDGALREYFYHGREIFNDRQAKLQRVARKTNLTPFCAGLFVSYDDRLASWKNQYLTPDPSVV
jgi:hypothetical protein